MGVAHIGAHPQAALLEIGTEQMTFVESQSVGLMTRDGQLAQDTLYGAGVSLLCPGKACDKKTPI